MWQVYYTKDISLFYRHISYFIVHALLLLLSASSGTGMILQGILSLLGIDSPGDALKKKMELIGSSRGSGGAIFIGGDQGFDFAVSFSLDFSLKKTFSDIATFCLQFSNFKYSFKNVVIEIDFLLI